MKSRELRVRLKKAGKETTKCVKTVAWQTCKCMLWTACAPCLCCALLVLPRRRHGRRGSTRRKYTEPQFPTPRPRALSTPLVELQEGQQTLDQPQSDFMTKLPLELRRMVYQHALGGVTIHLQTHDGKPRARQCTDAVCECYYFDPLHEQSLPFSLALLRTCRIIYSEAIEYLYSANTFSLSTHRDEQPTINYLSYYFLPQRLAQIRDLRLHWVLDTDLRSMLSDLRCPPMEPWVNSWDCLSRLTGLRKLHVVLEYAIIGDSFDQMWKAREEDLVAPFRTITAPREFVVRLPDRRCAEDMDIRPSRCVLVLPAIDGTEELS